MRPLAEDENWPVSGRMLDEQRAGRSVLATAFL